MAFREVHCNDRANRSIGPTMLNPGQVLITEPNVDVAESKAKEIKEKQVWLYSYLALSDQQQPQQQILVQVLLYDGAVNERRVEKKKCRICYSEKCFRMFDIKPRDTGGRPQRNCKPV